MEILSEKCTDNKVEKRELWEETIKVWDYLSDNGYMPSDFSQGEVKMNYQGFLKLAEEAGSCVSVKETRFYRLNALYIGNVELSYTEVKTDKDNWILDCKWEPLDRLL